MPDKVITSSGPCDCCGALSCTISIVSQPEPRVVDECFTANFSVGFEIVEEENEEFVGFQWQRWNGSAWEDLADGGQFSGVNTDYLQIAGVTLDMDGQVFRCALGCSESDMVYSDGAELTVIECVPADGEDTNEGPYELVFSEEGVEGCSSTGLLLDVAFAMSAAQSGPTVVITLNSLDAAISANEDDDDEILDFWVNGPMGRMDVDDTFVAGLCPTPSLIEFSISVQMRNNTLGTTCTETYGPATFASLPCITGAVICPTC